LRHVNGDLSSEGSIFFCANSASSGLDPFEYSADLGGCPYL